MNRQAHGHLAMLCFFTAVLFALAGPGCAKKGQTVGEPTDVEVVPEESVSGPGMGLEEGLDERDVQADDSAAALLRKVHFDFDRYNLTPEARQILRDNYAVLKGWPRANIQVEGHCDNRGTVEYNLALGQRRADAVRDYLVSLGMPSASLRTISYGEEMPLDPRDNEEAWALNRRAQFKILSR